MLEYYYTLLMLMCFSGMLLYSRSMPVAFLCLYIAYWFFPQGIHIVGTNVGFLSILGILEIVYFLFFYISRLKDKVYDRALMFKSIHYVAGIVLFYILIAFFGTIMPITEQFNDIKRFIFYSFNILLAASCLHNRREFHCIYNFVIVLIIFSGIYGIYTYVIQSNPFAELVIATYDIFEEQGMGVDFLETNRGFLYGRISGLTVHPLLYGGLLVLCFFLLLSYYKGMASKMRKAILILVLSFCLLLIILTGSRSILIGLLCGIFYYFIKIYPQKVLRYAMLGFILFMAFGLTIEDEYIRSILFFWEEHDEIKGSSKSMRIDQILAAIDIISDDFQSLLFGFGRGWITLYLSKFGNVPPFQGFEGLFISSFVEYGLLGTILYLLAVFVPLYRLNYGFVKKSQERTLNMAFLLSGFTIYVFTGHSYGQWLYLVLAFLMIRYSSCLETEACKDSDCVQKSMKRIDNGEHKQ